MKRLLSSILLISSLFFPTISMALELQYPQINIPGFGTITLQLGMDLATFVAWFYYFIITIAGLAAFVMVVWGGIQWLTSAGNPSKISDAKGRITSTLIGLLIILGSWIILKVINPQLTVLSVPGLTH